MILCAAAAVVVLFPLSVYPTLFHRSPNLPLHLMVLDHLTAYFQGADVDLNYVLAADFPNGRPVRVIGWPFQLMAVPLEKYVQVCLEHGCIWNKLRRSGNNCLGSFRIFTHYKNWSSVPSCLLLKAS